MLHEVKKMSSGYDIVIAFMRQPNRRKRVPRADKRGGDSSHPHC